METWRDVVGYEGLYEVSDQGRVRSKDRSMKVVRSGFEYILPLKGTILKPQDGNHGYKQVWLYGCGGASEKRNGRLVSVHRIVAEAFCEKHDGDTEVNHLNEIKDDNRAENLEWCTHKENSNYGTRGERLSAINTNGKQSRIVRQYTLDGELVAEYPSMAEVQRSTGFRKGNIWKQMTGQYEHAYGFRWTH